MHDRTEFKKGGRFIKKGDALRNTVSVSNFSLLEICDMPTTLFDNPNRCIAHRVLHEDDTFENGVRAPTESIKKFEPEKKRPIMKPINFTDDWKRQRQRMQNRRGRIDEEEEFELEMEYLKSRRDEDDDGEESFIPEPPLSSQPEATSEVAAEKRSLQEVDEGTKAGQDAFFKIKHETEVDEAAEAPDMVEEKVTPPVEQSAFIPMDTAAGPGEPLEAKAVKTYQEQLLEREQAVQEAKAKGYEDGFKLGEEKATLQAKSTLASLVSEFGNLLAEVQGLKKGILQNAQENFYVLCKTLLEALLRKEFALNPDSFVQLIRRAIKEALPDDSFKVAVHPDTMKNISRFLGSDLQGKVSADENVPKGEFRLESKMTVVDGNISQLVTELMDQADLQLFGEEKAG